MASQETRLTMGLGSLLCFSWAGICYRLYRNSLRDVAAIDSAFEVNAETLHLLPKQIESSSKRRVLIKLSGFLVAAEPLKVPEAPNEESLFVRRKTIFYTNMARHFESDPKDAYAEHIQVKVKEKLPAKVYATGPELFIGRNIVSAVDTTLAHSKPTLIGTNWFSKAIGLGLISIPWKTDDTVEIVRQGTHVSAVLDAVTDASGRITLIESNSISDRKIVTSSELTQILDAKQHHARIWQGFSAASGFVGAALAALCFISKPR